MFENAVQKRLAQQNKDIAISVPGRSICLLLMEMAWSRGLDAWLDLELPGITWIRGNEFQVEEILEMAILPAERMKVRALENLAKAIVAAGDAPSEELKEAIKIAQGRLLACLSERM
ncbi:MAG: hypothetical protein JSV16_09385 [Candidatus Hydrogenedentota bacterium]|nr:MAG: hypothetical protein JSV16_09385 [Candidatus Hydrogenedentota bacterium]